MNENEVFSAVLHNIVMDCFFITVKHNTFSDIVCCDIKSFIYSTLGLSFGTFLKSFIVFHKDFSV